MGIDDFLSEDDDNPADSGRSYDDSGSTGGGGFGGPSKSWTPKLDFSKPYVIVAEDRTGEIYVSKSDYAIIRNSDDWRRIAEDDPPKFLTEGKEYHILCQWSTKEHWLNFCDLVANQFDEDPNELLEDDIERLIVLDEEVYWPPGRKPSSTRTCQVCGATSNDESITMLELDLHESRNVPVCSSHSIEELAENGYLS